MKKIKNAIILLNMGGPNNLNEVEVFLKNMFSDPNILTMKSSLLRKFVGSMITLFRTESSQEIYRQLGGKSPIVGHSKDLVKALQKRMGDDFLVDYAMAYTPPFSQEVVQRVQESGVENIYLIPLYAQYSTTTTKTSLEYFTKAMSELNYRAVVYEIKHFFEAKKYNEAIINRLKQSLGEDSAEDFHLIFSAHGLPQKIVDAGDVYQLHVEKNVDILKDMLKDKEINFSSISLAYQSKIGPMQWLTPSLNDALENFKDKKVLIYPIAFILDNSETDFELLVEYKEIADELGIKEYRVSKCINSEPMFIDFLSDTVKNMRIK